MIRGLPGAGVPLKEPYIMPQGAWSTGFRGIKIFPEGSMSVSLVLLYHLLSICHVIIFLSVCAYVVASSGFYRLLDAKSILYLFCVILKP